MFIVTNLIAVIALIVFASMFAIANQGTVAVTIPGGLTFTRVPLFVLVFVPLFGGFIFGSLTSWIRSLKYRYRAKQCKRDKKHLEEELDNLRNLPLENDIQL